MSRSLYLVPVLALLIPACSASEAAAPPPATGAKAQPASTGDGKALCVEVFTRNRTCTAQYIPALVDARARHDVPAGIAADVAANRDAVIAQANEEWAVDSTDAAIDALCTRVTANPSAMDSSDATTAQGCLANADCTAYTACIMPLFEKRFSN